jgi:hypothetical protein
MDPKIKKILNNHEERIKSLEKQISPRKVKKVLAQKNYTGLAGGIRFLIKNGFLNDLKSLNEIISELKREGYHYSNSGVSSTLSETFIKSQRILNRVKEGKVWKYVIRK